MQYVMPCHHLCSGPYFQSPGRLTTSQGEMIPYRDDSTSSLCPYLHPKIRIRRVRAIIHFTPTDTTVTEAGAFAIPLVPEPGVGERPLMSYKRRK